MPAVRDWGRRDYGPSLTDMRALVLERRAGRIPDTLILVEHPPVVTVGVQGDDGGAAASGLPVVSVERGGHATYHGPGQLVGYPIVDLAPRGRDVRRFVQELEAGLVEALATWGVRAGHVAGQRGVWVDGARKIASIGIAVDHWVTFHGFALNVDLDLAPFQRFQPCGMSGARMTSIAREIGRPVPLAGAKRPVVDAWLGRFAPGGPAAEVAAPDRPGLAPA
ncbi:MAG TPA: lipoyl(octanoyl) transferase LipB [Thermoplasmata archaeon]|nr:lipoyl(octanoyl) transferase LipB [Thermoplasmata archaeon]